MTSATVSEILLDRPSETPKGIGGASASPSCAELSPQPSLSSKSSKGEGRNVPQASPLVLDLWLDLLERMVVLGFYLWLVGRLLEGYLAAGGLASLLLVPSEGVVVFFMIIRKSSREMSRRAWEWLLALAATCTPMLVVSGGATSLLAPELAASVLLVGLFVQVYAKITLGRCLGCVPAHRGLKLCGPYGVVRHPMYAGYLLCHLAFLSLYPSLWNVAIYSLCYALQIPRLLAEERLLRHDPLYRAYQAKVRYRLLPGVY